MDINKWIYFLWFLVNCPAKMTRGEHNKQTTWICPLSIAIGDTSNWYVIESSIHSALEICWEFVWIHHQWYEMILVQTWCKSNKKMHISLVIPKKKWLWIKHGIWVYPMFSQHLILCLPLLANHRWLRTWRRFGYHRLYDWAPGDGLGQCGGLKECQLMSVIWVFLKTEHRQLTMSFNTKVV